MSRRISYADGVAWIGDNDEPTLRSHGDTITVSELVSVAMLADISGREAIDVAEDVIAYRRRQDKAEGRA